MRSEAEIRERLEDERFAIDGQRGYLRTTGVSWIEALEWVLGAEN
jgi:hypothetical protein